MSDDIEVHFDPRRGELSLACGDESYARLRDLIFEEALSDEIPGSPTLDARCIYIESGPIVADRGKIPWLLAVFYLLVTVLLLIFLVGCWTILHWIAHWVK